MSEGVKEVKLSDSEKQQLAQDQKGREESFAKDLIKTFDLPTSIADAVDDKLADSNDEPVVEETDATETEETEISESETTETKSEETETEEKEDEDLVPKSKVQKRIDELTRKSKQLEAELERLRSEREAKVEKQDDDISKLEKMSENELHSLKKKVALAIRREQDDTKAEQLLELEEKINRTIESAPQRFQRQQVERFQSAVNASEFAHDEKAAKILFDSANQIYSQVPELQKSVDGQARAWQLAEKYYREMSKLSVGKSEVNELKQKVNSMKKKVSLDTAVQKGNASLGEEAKLYNKAKSGTFDDKQSFFKKRLNTDALIPDEFKQR